MNSTITSCRKKNLQFISLLFTLHNRHVTEAIITTRSLSGRLSFNCYSVTSPLLWPQGEDISDATRDGGSLIFLTGHFYDGKVPSGRSAFEGSRNRGNILRSKQTIVIQLAETASGNFRWKLLGMEAKCRGRPDTRTTSHTVFHIVVVDVPHS